MITSRIKKLTITIATIAIGMEVQAQLLNSAYFIDGTSSRHTLNPAFANEQGYVSIPALGSLNVKMQGNFGLQDVLFKNPESGYYNRTFMHPDVSVNDALSGFSKGNNRILADVDITLLAAGFRSFGGYSTIEVKEKTSAGIQLPYELLEFAKDINNRNYTFDGIHARAMSFVEIAMGHSHAINEQLRIGAKLKALLGMARTDLNIDNMKANFVGDEWDITSGEAEANVNMKGIMFKNTTSDYNYRSGSYEHVDLGETDVDGFGIGGFGMGVDLGAEFQVMENLKVSAALNDLGFIAWSNNYLLKQKAQTFTFDGFHDVAVKSETTEKGDILDDQVDNYSDQLSDFVSLQNEGDTGGKTTMLAATLNIGGEYTLPMYEPLTIGLLGQHRFNGDFSWTEGRLSANWKPLNWLDGCVNFCVGSYAVSTGWIVNIHPKGFNFFIGMDHILGKMSKEFIPLSSNANFSMGMAITWGGSKKEEINSRHNSSRTRKTGRPRKS